ncbi:MAG: WbuC family cupin fold metalloprotein [Gammaproteobacteria bacterium]
MQLITQNHLESLSSQAQRSARRRANWNLHPRLADPIQRFCNAMEPGTYVRPHRHQLFGRWELFLAITGAALVVTFGHDGSLLTRTVIGVDGPHYGLEIPVGVWHTVVSLRSGTVLFEVKPGPYAPLTDKDFAPWAPAEGESACTRFERWFREGSIGSHPPSV